MNSEFLAFLSQSPTPFHASENLASLVKQSGFKQLSENDEWQLVPGEAYYFMRSGSSFIAFICGNDITEVGVRIMGAHTDSPCLRLKPKPEKLSCGYQQFGIEVYGGALLGPWFDRDLSLAGKVSWLDSSLALRHSLVDFKRPMAIIPSLAIHLDREVNGGRAINPETHMKPIWCQTDVQKDFREYLKQYLLDSGVKTEKVLDFNLSFYDTQAAAIIGENEDFISGARLDNLLSCFFAAKAIIQSRRDFTTILVCNDHEEVGSCSDIGAQGSMLNDLLERLQPDGLKRQGMLRSSVMVSVDNAHGIHPNYPLKHDKSHGPVLNGGPVLKFDAKQGYATSSDTSALMRHLATLPKEQEIPLQAYSTRADMRCGSTIGPITAARTGIKTVDLGVATFAMHSIRELAGSKDTGYLHQLLLRFINQAFSLS